MSLHHFTLIVDGPDVQQQALVDALFEAGCDDGLVGRSEVIQYIEFDREAPGLDDAVLSAVADVEKVPGVTVARIADAGLVSMAGIAARTGRTREGVRLLIAGARGPGVSAARDRSAKSIPALALVRGGALDRRVPREPGGIVR